MNMPHSQVKIDAFDHYFPCNGQVSGYRYVTEVIEAATDLSVSGSEFAYPWNERETSFSVATRPNLGVFIAPSSRGFVVCLAVENSTGLKLESSPDSVADPLRRIYALERSKQHRAASKVIFRFIEASFADSNLAAINLMLKTIDMEELSKWSVSGLVRFTACAKEHLPAWSATYHNAKAVLTANGESAEKLLAGIRE